jgi:signal transduction histidine kinase
MAEKSFGLDIEQILEFLAEITSMSELEVLLELFTTKVPRVLKIRRCSVYLLPEFVASYDGELIDGFEQPIRTRSTPGQFIVLAHTNYPGKMKYAGKLFYPSGVDLTGWVFKTGRSLRLKDSRNLSELVAIDPSLTISKRYKFAEMDDSPGEPRPVLYIPLKTNSHTIGVLKLHRPEHIEFSIEDEKLATIIAQVIAGVLQKIQILHDRDRKILSLAELSTKRNLEDVFNNVTSAAQEVFDCPKCELYLRNEDGDKIVLTHLNGHPYQHERYVAFSRGSELLGWVFKTGQALYLEDLHDFVEKVYLDDERLSRICDTVDVDEEDREIESANKDFVRSLHHPIPFMAVPIFANDDSVQGVLCAHFLTKTAFKRNTPFDETELQRLKAFATTIGFAILFDAARNKADMLVKLAQTRDITKLYEFVVKSLSKVIYGTDCFIFEFDRSKTLNLVASTGGVANLQYKIGQGKTGFAAKARMPLIIDHFGAGDRQHKRLKARRIEILNRHPSGFVLDLLEENKQEVGLLYLQNGRDASEEVRAAFLALADKPITDRGLSSDFLGLYEESLDSPPSHSFAVVPIFLDNKELGGVISIARAVDRNPFAFGDIEFVEVVANQLGSTLSNQRLLAQREQFMIAAAHELDLPLTSLIAAAEASSEMTKQRQKRALVHLINEAQVLSLKVQTALVILSGETPRRRFSKHSIYRPLMNARELFQREARDKGCYIKPPRSADLGEDFPVVEISLEDMETAFKNLVHNAVKYSYKSSQHNPQRYVNIWGYWSDQEKTHYNIAIQNFGVGITEEEIRSGSIFDKYVRGARSFDRSRTGAGFGLTHVKHIIEDLHHGSIDVTSDEQEGGAFLTTFTVTLPVVQSNSSVQNLSSSVE